MSITKEENSAFVVGTGNTNNAMGGTAAPQEDPAAPTQTKTTHDDDPEKGVRENATEERPKGRSGKKWDPILLLFIINSISERLVEIISKFRHIIGFILCEKLHRKSISK